MPRIGYCRTSSGEQNEQLQRDALREAGCEKIFADHGVPGSQRRRPQLTACLAVLKPGDVLVVWALDRLGRNLVHLAQLIEQLTDARIGFKSLKEGMDTEGAAGLLYIQIMAAVAQFERARIAERVRAGQAVARKRGTHLGRPRLLTPERMKLGTRLLGEGRSPREVARMFNCSESTIYLNIISPAREESLRQELATPDEIQTAPIPVPPPVPTRKAQLPLFVAGVAK